MLGGSLLIASSGKIANVETERQNETYGEVHSDILEGFALSKCNEIRGSKKALRRENAICQNEITRCNQDKGLIHRKKSGKRFRNE